MTPAEIIAEARYTINDTDTISPRNTDAELLAYVNDGLSEISVIRPDLFQVLGDLDCIANQCDQMIAFADAQALVDVLCIHGGNAVTQFDMAAMNAFHPGWRSDSPGPAVQWSRKQGDLLRFFIYPPAPNSQSLDVMYVRNPTTVALATMITEVPLTFKPALVQYVVYRTESKDDEHVLSGRAAASYAAFGAMVKGAPA